MTSQVRPASNTLLTLVTGAQRGIGSAIAGAFARAGHDVVIADIDAGDSAEQWRERWRLDSGSTLLTVRTDVSKPEEVDALFECIDRHFDRPPDVLVNNAAVQVWSSLLEHSHEDWQRVLAVNVGGTFLMSQRFAHRRIAIGGGGVVINLGSGCNTEAFPHLSSYASSKGAIQMLTRSSALELGTHGIRVNCVAPGAILTERTAAETEDYAARWAPLTPLGRAGTVDDVANLVLALSRDDLAFVSGETIRVDGGLFCQAPWPRDY